MPTTSVVTTLPNDRHHHPRAPRDDGRRRSRPNTGPIRQSIRRMGRASGQFRETLQMIHWFTGTIVEKMQYRRITSERALAILELCREMSRDLSQGNVPRAWSSLIALLDSYGIFEEETLKLEKHTHVRRVFKAVTEEVIQPELRSLPDEIIERCAELGFDVRPVSEQFGIPRGKRDPKAFGIEGGGAGASA